MNNTAYLCGGINGLSDSDCNDWRISAKDLLVGPTLDPMRRDYRGIEDQNVTDIVINDIEDIRKSNVILVNATRPTWGTAMEIVYAYRHNRPVFAFVGDSPRVSPWLRYHSHSITKTMEEAAEAINARLRKR